MKKFATIFVLLAVLSLTVPAEEGTTHSGGKSCPAGQTCLTTAPVEPDKSEDTVITKILVFLKTVFG